MTAQTLPNLIVFVLEDYLKGVPAASLLDLCNTAEEWHDDPKSAMYAFYQHRGVLVNKRQYRKLVKEVHAALAQCVLGNNWSNKLKELMSFAMTLHQLETTLLSLCTVGGNLKQYGVPANIAVKILDQAMQ